MNYSARANISDIQKFIRSLQNLNDILDCVQISEHINDNCAKIQNEITHLQRSKELNNELLNLINEKLEKATEKISIEKQKIEKTKTELEQAYQKLASITKGASGIINTVIAAPEIAALNAKLAAEEAHLQKLRICVDELKVELKKTEARDKEIDKEIQKFEEAECELGKAGEEVENILSQIKDDCSPGISRLESAVQYLNDYLSISLDKFVESNGETVATTHFESRDEVKKIGISYDAVEKISENTGYSTNILLSIRSEAEGYKYSDYNLKESIIGGKACLIQPDISFTAIVSYKYHGETYYTTNMERMLKGQAPLDSNGRPIELHHIGQEPDAPLAELTIEQHRRNKNYDVLHTSVKEPSKIDRHLFAILIKKPYWKAKAREFLERQKNERGQI